MKHTIEPNRRRYEVLPSQIDQAEADIENEPPSDGELEPQIDCRLSNADDENTTQRTYLTNFDERWDESAGIASKGPIQCNIIPDDNFHASVRCLNEEQRSFFYSIVRHCKNVAHAGVIPFLSGGAGTGKSLPL